MTYENPDIIAVMLLNEGVYPGDPKMSLIFSYTGMSGKEVYAVFAHLHQCDVYTSPWVKNPILLFNSDTGLTLAGHEWLAKYKLRQVHHNAQPFYHRGVITFKATAELSEEMFIAMLKDSLSVDCGIVLNSIQIEEWEEPEPGDPADLL